MMLFTKILPISLHLILYSYVAKEVTAKSMRFHLRHAHGQIANSSRVVFSDFESSAQFIAEEALEISTLSMKIPRARSQADFFAARSLGNMQHALAWDEIEVVGPNISQRETLRMLANMTNNAYYENRETNGWYHLGPEWNTV